MTSIAPVYLNTIKTQLLNGAVKNGIPSQYNAISRRENDISSEYNSIYWYFNVMPILVRQLQAKISSIGTKKVANFNVIFLKDIS